MPTFPSIASTRIVGPNEAVVLVVAKGTTDSPLQILNENESGVFEVTIDGLPRTIAGSFWVRGPSITSTIVLV